MTVELETLSRHIEAATGSDAGLDAELSRVLGGGAAANVVGYTASVDCAVDLVRAVLPGWSWHLGWNASGILPYATLSHGERRISAAAATVPLALLRALARALHEEAAISPPVRADGKASPREHGGK